MKQERKNNFFEKSETNGKYLLIDEYYRGDYYGSYNPPFRLKFDAMNLYLEKSQNMIDEIPDELKAKIQAWDINPPEIPDAPPEMPSPPAGFEQYYEEIMTLGEYNSILYNSTFISVYSWFESEFLFLCKYCKEEENLKLGAKDIKGNGYIDQCKKFITKLLDVNLDSLKIEWDEIVKCQRIRNCIVHQQGWIADPLSGKDLVNFINRTDGIKYTTRIEIESIDFIKNFNNLVFKYLTGICSEILRQKTQNHPKKLLDFYTS